MEKSSLWFIGAVINGQHVIRHDRDGNMIAFLTKDEAEQAIKERNFGPEAFAFDVPTDGPIPTPSQKKH